MTGLMMVFLLIAILYMRKVQIDKEKEVKEAQRMLQVQQEKAERDKERELLMEKLKEQAEQLAKKAKLQASKITDLAVVYEKNKRELYAALMKEFQNDLPKWRANIDESDLSIRFEEPDILFDIGKYELKPAFKSILENFFPRYINILSCDQYKGSIDEIRIEGHTSSLWNGSIRGDDAYTRNMELSQSRTRATLSYLLGLQSIQHEKKWLITHLTANGLSSSRLRLNQDGSENALLSQRVEFRVRTNADKKIEEIIESTAQ
jgi:outer membrane protein OmpA-like peptidoglycan-associated protein